MERTLSQDSINIPEDDSEGQAELWQVKSARLGLSTCDLQLWKVITSSSEFQFGSS